MRHITLGDYKVIDSKIVVDITGLDGEDMVDRPYIEQFGFQSRPPIGSKGLGVFIGGMSEKAVAVGLNDASYNKDLNEGESRLYDKFGNEIYLQDGEFQIVANGNLTLNVTGNVSVNAQEASITASQINLNGNVGSSGGNFSIGGSGGQGIARIGDQVIVNGQIGQIITGSSIASST